MSSDKENYYEHLAYCLTGVQWVTSEIDIKSETAVSQLYRAQVFCFHRCKFHGSWVKV